MNVDNYILLDVDGSISYYGYNVNRGATGSDSNWAIRRVVTVGSDTTEDWVGGSAFGYIAVWDDRTSYFTEPSGSLNFTYSIATRGESSTIFTSWDRLIGLTRYEISVTDENGILLNALGSKAINRNWTTSIKDVRLAFPGKTNQTYDFSVSAINNAGFTVSTTQIVTPDTIAPNFVIQPNATIIGATGVYVYSQLNENGTVYAYTLNHPSVNVSVDTILTSGFNTSDTGSGATISITGLTSSTNYNVWVVAQDDAGNVQSGPFKLDVKTIA